MMHKVTIQRLYDSLQPGRDNAGAAGFRVFIDRLWPRGVPKADFHYDLWCKDLAPSPELRKWFGHRVARWDEFSSRYQDELRAPGQQDRMRDLAHQAGKKPIVLLYGAKDTRHNHAVVLKQALEHIQSKG